MSDQKPQPDPNRLISLGKALKIVREEYGINIDRTSMRDWIKSGRNGHKLWVLRAGQGRAMRYLTTRAAISEFLFNTTLSYPPGYERLSATGSKPGSRRKK